MNKIKVGILGGSKYSAVGRAHINALQLDGKFEILGACFSKNLETNQESADFYGVSKIFNSLEDLTTSLKGKLDFVIVLTPTSSHFEHVKYLLDEGLNVICEKSLSTSSKHARELFSIAKRNKLRLYVTYNYIGYPIVKDIRNLITKNTLGKLMNARVIMPQQSFIKLNADESFNTPQKWRQEDYEIPTISLDLGVHVFSLISYLGIEINKSSIRDVHENNFGKVKGVIDDVHCTFNIKNGGWCNIWYSKVALGEDNGLSVEVYFSEGSLKWCQIYPEDLKVSDKYGTSSVIKRGHKILESSRGERYNRFKAGHPHGFIEAFGNLYMDIYSDYFQGENSSELLRPKEIIEGLEVLEMIHSFKNL